MKDKVKLLNERFKNESTQSLVEYLVTQTEYKAALSSSFGKEDQVLTDMMFKANTNANIFTLDTGRLPYETYDVMDATNLKYNTKVDVYFPKSEDVEALYTAQGINGFYESVENRKKCCFARKVAPLQRALEGLDIWITGLRSAQAVTREDMDLFEYDEKNKVIKVSPLVHWSEEEVSAYIAQEKVPSNKLHALGYPSIGCAPCTRAVKEGEDIRSGRWWWENPEHKECGLHLK